MIAIISEIEVLALSYYGKNAPPPAGQTMSRTEEKKAFLRYAKRKNARDREALIRQYLCWAFGMAAKFKGPRLGFDDAISAANEGLVEALNAYKPRLGFRFSTFASFYLRRHLISAIVATYPVHVSDHVRKKWRELEEDPEKQALAMRDNEPSTVEEFFSRLGETVDVDIAKMHERPEDSPFMPAPGENPADVAADLDVSEEVKVALRTLEPTERDVVLARHYKEPSESYLEIGRRLRISKSRAKEIYELGLRKLRQHFEKDK